MRSCTLKLDFHIQCASVLSDKSTQQGRQCTKTKTHLNGKLIYRTLLVNANTSILPQFPSFPCECANSNICINFTCFARLYKSLVRAILWFVHATSMFFVVVVGGIHYIQKSIVSGYARSLLHSMPIGDYLYVPPPPYTQRSQMI